MFCCHADCMAWWLIVEPHTLHTNPPWFHFKLVAFVTVYTTWSTINVEPFVHYLLLLWHKLSGMVLRMPDWISKRYTSGLAKSPYCPLKGLFLVCQCTHIPVGYWLLKDLVVFVAPIIILCNSTAWTFADVISHVPIYSFPVESFPEQGYDPLHTLMTLAIVMDVQMLQYTLYENLSVELK